MRSAKTVMSSMAITITPPMAPSGLRRANLQSAASVST
jgi:hypothetical protein